MSDSPPPAPSDSEFAPLRRFIDRCQVACLTAPARLPEEVLSDLKTAFAAIPPALAPMAESVVRRVLARTLVGAFSADQRSAPDTVVHRVMPILIGSDLVRDATT